MFNGTNKKLFSKFSKYILRRQQGSQANKNFNTHNRNNILLRVKKLKSIKFQKKLIIFVRKKYKNICNKLAKHLEKKTNKEKITCIESGNYHGITGLYIPLNTIAKSPFASIHLLLEE